MDDADARADLPVLVETNKDDRSTTGQIDVIFFVPGVVFDGHSGLCILPWA